MGNEQQNEGRMDQVRGTIKEKVGEATDNQRMQREGDSDKAKGAIREGIGNVREDVGKAADKASGDWQRNR